MASHRHGSRQTARCAWLSGWTDHDSPCQLGATLWITSFTYMSRDPHLPVAKSEINCEVKLSHFLFQVLNIFIFRDIYYCIIIDNICITSFYCKLPHFLCS